MGSKFYHLRIPGGDPDAAAALCPGCAVRPLAGGWVAVSGPSLAWGTIQREARRLSRALPVPVLSTEYFDGDYVELALYRGGRRVARHVPASYESFPRCPGRSRAWAEQLGLSAEAEGALAAVFREGRPEVCLRLLECVLGCPLWGDGDGAGSSAPPGQAYLTDYLARRAGTEKLRDRTRLVLLDQVEGDFGWDLTYPAVRVEPEAWLRSFWDIRDGALRRLCACALPKESPEPFRAQARGEGAFLLTFCRCPNTGEPKGAVRVFSDGGELLATLCQDGPLPLHGAFLDRDRVFLEGACWNIRTGQKEWDLEIGRTAYGVCTPRPLPGGRAAVMYDTTAGPEDMPHGHLVSFLPDGSGRVVLDLPPAGHWTAPVAWRGGCLLGCGGRLICLGPTLETLWAAEPGELANAWVSPQLDPETDTLYLSGPGRITAFDLRARRVRAVRELDDGEDGLLRGVLPGVGPILLTGDSSLQVRGQELELLSRHRTRGALRQILHQDGRTYLLASTGQEHDARRTEHGRETAVVRPGCLRLYELTVPSRRRGPAPKVP